MIKSIKKTDIDNIFGTSFHNTMAFCTYADLVEMFGTESCQDGDKTHYEWFLEVTCDDRVFYATIYDWKEPFAPNKYPISWHIGGLNKTDTEIVANYIFNFINA